MILIFLFSLHIKSDNSIFDVKMNQLNFYIATLVFISHKI